MLLADTLSHIITKQEAQLLCEGQLWALPAGTTCLLLGMQAQPRAGA